MSQNLAMLLIISLISVLMFVYSNTLMYCVGLLILSSVLLLWMVLHGFLSVLVFLLISLVYIGAVMILVGYVCAVSPNLVFSSSGSGFIFLIPLVMTLLQSDCELGPLKKGSLSDFFLSEWGLYLFFYIVVMLFVVLLIVTFQFFSPQGPLRSK